MDKETLSHYGWIVVLVLILSCMIALATPFGKFIARGFESTYVGMFFTADNAMGLIRDPSNKEVKWTGDWTWSFNEDGETITLHQYIGKDALTTNELIVPNRYQPDESSPYYTVTKVQNKGNTYKYVEIYKGNVIDSNRSIYNVLGEIPNDNLKKITFSNGVQIGDAVCYGMQNLETIVLSNDCGKEIGESAFLNCKKLTGELIIPESVEVIRSRAFGLTNLKSVKITKNVKTIGTYTFNECKNLSKADFSEAINLEEIHYGAFCQNIGITEKLDFSNASKLKLIDDYAFKECYNIAHPLDLSKTSLKKIGESGFAAGYYGQPTKFTALYLPDCLEEIGPRAFAAGRKFSNELILPKSLKFIGDAAFQHCVDFTNEKLVIPQTVIQIGKLKIGDAVVNERDPYASHVFYNFATRSLQEFEVEDGNTSFVDVDGVLYTKDKTRLVFYPPARKGTTYKVLDGVVSIDGAAFGHSGAMYEHTSPNKLANLELPNSFVIKQMESASTNSGHLNNLSTAVYKSTISNVTFPDDNTLYTTVDGCVYSKDMKTLYFIPTGKTYVDVPEGVENLFIGCISLVRDGGTIYNLPSTIISVDNGINTMVKEIGRQSDLLTITIPENCVKYKVIRDTTSETFGFYQIVEK